MKGFFLKLFNVYSGEEKNAFLFAGLGFLWALGVTSGQKFADALFLLHVGAESLPLAYIITACVMMVLAAFLLKAFQVISIDRIFIGILLTGVFFYFSIYLCLLTNFAVYHLAFWFVLKIFGALLFAIVVTCFWTFIDQYFHLQDAKRLYSLFTSAVFLGLASTGAIMRSGLIDFQNLTLVIITLLLLACYRIRKIVQTLQPIHDEQALENSGELTDHSFKSLLQSILKSRFTLLLMTGNFLMFLFMVTTEYSYLSAFDQHFDPGTTAVPGNEEKARLTIFLGQCIAGVSVINLFFGMFLYSRLVRRFGISNMLLCTPVVLLITYSGWLVDDILLFPLMGFFVVEGMLYIIDDNNFTLMLNAVPSKIKYRVRLIIESFFEPTGMLVSSLLLTFAPIDSRKLGLILACFAIIVALLLRKQYLKAIYHNLAENAIHFQRTVRDWITVLPKKQQLSMERRLLAILYRGDESARLLAIEALLEIGNPAVLRRLLKRVDTFSVAGKIAYLSMVDRSLFANHPQVLEKLKAWLKEPIEPRLQSTIHFYLAKRDLLPPTEVHQDLESDDLTRHGAAILALKKEGTAQQDLQALLESQDEEEVCMGAAILGLEANPADIDRLLPLLKHASIKVARCAANSIASISNARCRQYAPILITQLTTATDTEIRQACLRALSKLGDSSLAKEMIASSVHFRPNERRLTDALIFQMGAPVVPILLAITQDTGMHDRCRSLAGAILGRLSLSTLRNHLYDIVTAEISRAYFYFYHTHTIQKEYPQYDLSLLRDALLSSYHSVMDFIIQLLGVAGESEDRELLARSLRSSNPKVRSHVIETLEKTCETKIFRALYPLIAELPLAEKLRIYEKNHGEALNLSELLDRMSQSLIPGDRLIALAVRYRLKMPNWRESIRQQLTTNDEIFQHFARELLET